MTSSIVKIFDHNLLIKNRNRSVKSFKNVNFVHHLIADLMLEIMLDQKNNFEYKLKKVSTNILPDYIQNNLSKFKDFVIRSKIIIYIIIINYKLYLYRYKVRYKYNDKLCNK